MSAKSPIVSVIVPTYNAGHFIERALQSVVDQTFQYWDAYVVDDGSIDDTLAKINSFCIKDSRVHLLRQKNQGSASARNTGIYASSGLYLAFLDADDIWHPTKLEKQVNAFVNARNEVGLIYTWCRMIDNLDYVQGHTGTPAFETGQVFMELLIYNFVGNGSVPLVKRSCLPKPRAFDEDQAGNDDFLFYLRIAANVEFDYVPEYLVGYRWNTGQNKSSNIERLVQSRLQMITKVVGFFPDLSPRRLAWCNASLSLSIAQVQFKKGMLLQSLKTIGPTFLKTPSYIFSAPFRRALKLGGLWIYRKAIKRKPRKENFFNLDPTRQ